MASEERRSQGAEEALEVPKGGGGAKLMPLILVAALAGGVGGGSGWLAAGLQSRAAQASEAGAEEVVPQEEEEPEPEWELFPVDNLVVNPAGTLGRRFLILSATIEVEGDQGLPRLQAAEARLRDGILRRLGMWRVEDLADASLRGQVEEVIREVAGEIAGEAPVGRVFFSQFVIQ